MTGYQSKKAMAVDKLFDRDEAEQFLVEDDYQYVMQSDSGLEYLRDLLLIGFKGYCEFTDEELMAEIKQRNAMKEYL